MDMAADDSTVPSAKRPAPQNRALSRARVLAAQRAEFNVYDFVAIVSDDLRVPLRAMAELAMRIRNHADGEGADAIHGWAGDLLNSADSLERMIGDLAADSIGDGGLRLSRADVDMALLVAHVADVFAPLAAIKSIALSRDIAGPLNVHCDESRLVQVLANLVDNAIQFTPQGGCVRVRAAREGSDCVVSVIDTGIGIPKSELTSVFAPIRALGPSEQPTWRLGLYSSRGIVEAHNGRIWAEGEAGCGSTFYLTLPIETGTISTDAN
jgi:signal transduction histidine kinase